MIEFIIRSSEAGEYIKKQEISWELKFNNQVYRDFVVVNPDWETTQQILPLLIEQMTKTIDSEWELWKKDLDFKTKKRGEWREDEH